MMRVLSRDQIDIFKKYAQLGKEISNIHGHKLLLNRIAWNKISINGIWKLPITKQYGGMELDWQTIVVALEGFFSNYSDLELLSMLISQISVLYLVSRYGTEIIKNKYLPRMLKGEIAQIVISEHINKFLNSFKNTDQKSVLESNDNLIIIHVEKLNNDIAFYINEKKHNHVNCAFNTHEKNSQNSNFFIANNVGISVLYDLINFERIIYGVISESIVRKIS